MLRKVPAREMRSIISLISVIRSDSKVFERLFDISRILNRDLRHVCQSSCVSSSDGPVSHLFLSGIPEARNTYRRSTAPVHAVFGWNDGGLPVLGGDIEAVTVITLSYKGTHQGYLGN
jgi:hypothetical protein